MLTLDTAMDRIAKRDGRKLTLELTYNDPRLIRCAISVLPQPYVYGFQGAGYGSNHDEAMSCAIAALDRQITDYHAECRAAALGGRYDGNA